MQQANRQNPNGENGQGSAALSGLTVLDLGQIYNGSYAGFLMAMAGARVIKVEPKTGETLRRRGTDSSSAFAFAMLNRNKESLTLDLKSDKGAQLLRKLARQADVLIENYAPDTMASLGLSADELCTDNPRLIYAAGSGYGREGAQRDFLAMDITVQAMSGVIGATGIEGQPPQKAGAALADFFGGIHLYSAIVTALMRRERDGRGCVLDVAMLDSVIPSLATVMGAYYFGGGQVQPRQGNRHPALTMAPYNVYPASDGHVAIICINDKHWRALCELMDRVDCVTDSRFLTMSDRARNMDELDGVVANWTARRLRAQLLEDLQRAGVPSAMVRDVEEVLNDHHLKERGMLTAMDHPVLGEINLPNSPLNVAMGNPVSPAQIPALGEHSQQVLGDLLGLSDEEIDDLERSGVI